MRLGEAQLATSIRRGIENKYQNQALYAYCMNHSERLCSSFLSKAATVLSR